MNRKYTWHLISWSIYVIYQYIEAFIDEKGFDFQGMALNTSYILTTIFTFYVFYFGAWKPYLKNGNKLKVILAAMMGLIFFIAFRHILEEKIFEVIFGFGNYRNDDLWYYFLDNINRAIFVAGCSLVVALLENKYELETDYLQVINEKSEAEMSLLRSQLNPHFLFNTLSFLHTKTFKLDPELADTVLKLSDMLRYSLQSSKADKVAIKSEIELLENYIAIFQNRFAGKFHVDFNVHGTQLQQRIEPLLLIPFVENAFKHGILSDADVPAKIKLEVTDGQFRFSCQNKINNYQKDSGSGIGLENVKRRLNLLYPERHELKISEREDTFFVDLTLELNN